MNDMIQVLGENYFIDLDSISKAVNMDYSNSEFSGDTEQTINLVSFEVVKMLLEIIMLQVISSGLTVEIKNQILTIYLYWQGMKFITTF